MDIYVRKNIPFREIDGYSIVHLRDNRAYLNPDGTSIWHMIDGCADVDAIALKLGAERGCSEEDAGRFFRPKVAAFLQDLHRRGLLLRRESEGPGVDTCERDGTRSATADSSGPRVRPADQRCATGTVSATAGDGIEKQFDALYWRKHYIQKMHLELTYRCNFHCVHCYNPTHSGAESELTQQEWERVLDQLAGMGCFLLVFTGGELFVRKDAAGILQAACQRGFSFRLSTNGSLIDERAVQTLEPMRPFLQSVDISFYGATPAMHDAVTRRAGSHLGALRGLNLLREAGLPLASKYVTLRDNFGGIPRFEADMRSLGVPYVVNAGSVIPQTDRGAAPLVQLLTEDQQLALRERRIAGGGGEPGRCRPGHIRGAVTPDGQVSPCEWLTDFKLGDLHERSLREIWYGEEFLAFRRLFEREAECQNCELGPDCDRCPAHSYLETGDLLVCAPVRRRNAEIVHGFHGAQTVTC